MKAQYELQCEKDNTDDKKELLEMGAKHGNLSINSENIFPIIKKWLYSDHDIFVREMISNGMRCDHQTEKAGSYGRLYIPGRLQTGCKCYR